MKIMQYNKNLYQMVHITLPSPKPYFCDVCALWQRYPVCLVFVVIGTSALQNDEMWQRDTIYFKTLWVS